MGDEGDRRGGGGGHRGVADAARGDVSEGDPAGDGLGVLQFGGGGGEGGLDLRARVVVGEGLGEGEGPTVDLGNLTLVWDLVIDVEARGPIQGGERVLLGLGLGVAGSPQKDTHREDQPDGGQGGRQQGAQTPPGRVVPLLEPLEISHRRIHSPSYNRLPVFGCRTTSCRGSKNW
ncbi:MAG: hypothetical protein JRH11_18800 [Deltaproteobacteria bacterium]|nr:hypothetical protein [Deltaproteobacteria bacterium]